MCAAATGLTPLELGFYRPRRARFADGNLSRAVPALIPSEARKCVVFLYMRDADGMSPVGTAFVVSQPFGDGEWRSLVTARHNIEIIRAHTVDQQVYVYVNDDDTGRREPVRMDLSEWRNHPDDIQCDPDEYLHPIENRTERVFDVAVAACPPDVSARSSVQSWHIGDFVTDDSIARHGIDVGDDLFCAGLYHQHHDTARNIPVVRSGIIAAMPQDPIRTEFGSFHGAYLGEFRSTRGLSGSPVWWSSGIYRLDHEAREFIPLNELRFQLLGLVWGHFRHKGVGDVWMNDGIAVVLPASSIVEALRLGELMEKRKAVRDEAEALSDSGAVMDSFATSDTAATGHDERVAMTGVDPEDALRALLKTPPHGQTEDPA